MDLTQFYEIYSSLNIIINLILAIVIPLLILKLINRTIRKYSDSRNMSSNSIETLSKILRYITFIIIFVAALEILGIDLHSLIVSVGLVSLAVTLAAKDTLSNFISGVIILLEKRFEVGDMIEIDGHKGQVEKIGFKSVELFYKKEYTVIPNVLFTTKPFVNHTKNGYYKIRFDIKMLNKYDLDEKIKQIENILEESDLILKEPEYLVFARNITTNGVEVRVKAYIDDPVKDSKIISALIKKIKKEIVLEDMY